MGGTVGKLHPNTIQELQEHMGVDFTKEEIKQWFKEFKGSLGPGQTELTRDDFVSVYNSLFCGDAKDFADHVFRTFDTDKSGSVNFKEFIFGLFVSGCEDPEKKLQWAFKVYDIDDDGFITKSEMMEIIESICKMTKTAIPKKYADLDELITEIFTAMDKNKDAKITFEEFKEGAYHNDFVINILQIDPDHGQDCTQDNE